VEGTQIKPNGREEAKFFYFLEFVRFYPSQVTEYKMKNNELIFSLVAGCAVMAHGVAAYFRVEACTLLPLLLIVCWAGLKFLSKEESAS
jgi:hypothetical protein